MAVGVLGEQLDLHIRQGATFGPFMLTLKNPDGSAVHVGNCTFRGQIRRNPTSALAAQFAFSLVGDGSAGQVTFGLTAAQTAALVAGASIADASSAYVYDIEYTDSMGRELPLLYGRALVLREVTK